MKKILFLAACFLAAPVLAEKADSGKRTTIEADAVDIDDVTQTKVLTGKVEIHRGTLVMKSDNAVVKESPDGYQTAVLTSAPGKMANFRQKRDGGADLWIEGQAERIEYDQKNELVRLYKTAKIRQLDGTRLENEIDSEFISYDSRKEVFSGRNDASGENKAGKGRVILIMEPRQPKPAASAPVPGKQ
ncbi:MAG: lipopolysaccharide transport periplasmic protein LptA [Pseudomonadota bacterium]